MLVAYRSASGQEPEPGWPPQSGMNKSIAVENARYTATDAIVGSPAPPGPIRAPWAVAPGLFRKR